MATPTIRATGSTTPANTPGEAKQAYIVGETITFDDPANPGASTHLWQLVDKPVEQSSALSSTTVASPTLLIDAGVEGGTYRIRYTADGTEVGELLFAVQTTSADIPNERIGGYLEQDDARAAATEATWNASSNTKGWFPGIYSLLKAIIAAFAGVLHKATAGEINAMTPKATVVAADKIVIEDSASSWAKKSATLTDLINAGGSSTLAQGDFVQANLSGPQAYSSGTAIDYDTEVAQRGGLSVDSAGKFSGLLAGRTYALVGVALINHSAAAEITYQWYDVTGAAAIGSKGRARTTTASTHNSNQPTAAFIFSPSVDSEVECRMLAGGTAGADIQVDYSYAQVFEIGGVENVTAGALELVDTIEVTGSAEQTRTFSASGHGALGAALNGDADETYLLEYYIPSVPAGNPDYEFRPNGLTTNQEAARHWAGSSAGDSGTETRLHLGKGIASGYYMYGRVEFHAASGKRRGFFNNLLQIGGSRFLDDYYGHWTDDSENVTSIDIYSSDASGLPVGSIFKLFRRRAIPVNSIVARTVLSSPSNTIALTGLNGDADGEYEISGKLILTALSNTLSLKLNGATTSVRVGTVIAGGAMSVSTVGVVVTSSAVGSRNEYSFKGTLWVKRTQNGATVIRSGRWQATHAYDSGPNMGTHDTAIAYEDAAANLTSLAFTNSVASGILAGSEVIVRKVL